MLSGKGDRRTSALAVDPPGQLVAPGLVLQRRWRAAVDEHGQYCFAAALR
jgi:hypothetical protein